MMTTSRTLEKLLLIENVFIHAECVGRLVKDIKDIKDHFADHKSADIDDIKKTYLQLLNNASRDNPKGRMNISNAILFVALKEISNKQRIELLQSTNTNDKTLMQYAVLSDLSKVFYSLLAYLQKNGFSDDIENILHPQPQDDPYFFVEKLIDDDLLDELLLVLKKNVILSQKDYNYLLDSNKAQKHIKDCLKLAGHDYQNIKDELLSKILKQQSFEMGDQKKLSILNTILNKNDSSFAKFFRTGQDDILQQVKIAVDDLNHQASNLSRFSKFSKNGIVRDQSIMVANNQSIEIPTP